MVCRNTTCPWKAAASLTEVGLGMRRFASAPCPGPAQEEIQTMPAPKTPLKTHGGKYYLARKIIELMPRHLHYVEPYAGGLSVLLARDPADPKLWAGDTGDDRGVSEVVGDLNGPLTTFWKVLGDE